MRTQRLTNHYVNSCQDIQFYYAGTEACEPGHAWGPGVKDHYKIFYVHSGRGTFRTSNMNYPLTQGEGFFMVPGELYAYEADLEDPWTYSWVAFNGGAVETYLQQAGLSGERPLFTCPQDGPIRQSLQGMLEADQTSWSKPLRMTAALYSFLAIVMDSVQTAPKDPYRSSMQSHYVAQALEFIETNYSRPVSIGDLAQSLGLNRKYIASLFKSAVGIPPQQYLCRYRMQKARDLMKSPLSIKEISYSVGYSDQLIFSRMFKKTYGFAPREYRQRAGGIKPLR
ncbi:MULTISPECIES: AraC family transcriptional regulator [Paenibacillus]|uniref:AraC family transcriptional regulator n=1 Tax=Paenibacillus TaxID=44249 RepID=UPI0022B895CD|nr:AraC family transcriptional regulator [Paenibacillus caseinilyticus]MCZ8520852.1 AraC family transcriptional regulator [Paenibacillus caseinilyticus]